MKKMIVMSIVFIQVLSVSAHAKETTSKVKSAAAVRAVAQTRLNWLELKQELIQMAKKFNDKKISEDARVSMLPHSNEVLSDIQDLTLTPEEKSDQIRTVVEFLAASIEDDFANSNTNTIYFDYKAHKAEYLKQIKSLGSSKRAQILEAFQEWEEFENEAGSPESEGDDE